MNTTFNFNAYDNLGAPFNKTTMEYLLKLYDSKNFIYQYSTPNLFRVPRELYDVFLNLLGKPYTLSIGQYVELSAGNGLAIHPVVQNKLNERFVGLDLYHDGTKSKSEIEQDLKAADDFKFNGLFSTINWYYSSKGEVASTRLCEVHDINIYDEAYPYIEEGIESYINRFLQSTETVLVLIGPPGTGKTRLTKYLMSKLVVPGEYRTEVAYTTSQEVIERDEFFLEFIRSDSRLMILEDIDLKLKSRNDGNMFMHKLLGASDGIIEIPDKKIILTTNLNNVRDIDEALLRPGRAFDVLRTRLLTEPETEKLSAKLGIPRTIQKEKKLYSLAEIYNDKTSVI